MPHVRLCVAVVLAVLAATGRYWLFRFSDVQ